MIDFNAVFAGSLIDYTKVSNGAGSTNDEGAWMPGVETQTVFKAVELQPLNMNELVNLPDGERQESYAKTYTTESLKIREGDQDADEVINSDGLRFKVMQSENRNDYFKVYLRLIR